MALIKCPECGHDMSTDADSCPNCGWKTAGKKASETSQSLAGCGNTLTIFVTIPVLIICFLVFGF